MIDTDSHARSIFDKLEADGLTVGDGIAPAGSDGRILAPCVIVHMLPGGIYEGGPDEPSRNSQIRFQLTSVGLTASQARITATRAGEALKDGGFTVDGRSIQGVEPFTHPGVSRDDDLTQPLFYAVQVWSAWSFAAPSVS